MSVNVIYSLTNGGDSISSNVDYGNAQNGDTTDAQEIFIRHDGDNEITGAALYIRDYSATYTGDATASADLSEILGWGDASTNAGFGGFQINFDADGSYPTDSWPTYSSKGPSNGFVHRTGIGDSELNTVTIPTAAGISSPYSAGEIPAGSSPNIRFKTRIQVPTNETVTGIRQFDQVITFSFTS